MLESNFLKKKEEERERLAGGRGAKAPEREGEHGGASSVLEEVRSSSTENSTPHQE